MSVTVDYDGRYVCDLCLEPETRLCARRWHGETVLVCERCETDGDLDDE